VSFRIFFVEQIQIWLQEKQRESGQRTITQEQKAQILALAEDFPR
jgi:hypothetical protein